MIATAAHHSVTAAANGSRFFTIRMPPKMSGSSTWKSAPPRLCMNSPNGLKTMWPNSWIGTIG